MFKKHDFVQVLGKNAKCTKCGASEVVSSDYCLGLIYGLTDNPFILACYYNLKINDDIEVLKDRILIKDGCFSSDNEISRNTILTLDLHLSTSIVLRDFINTMDIDTDEEMQVAACIMLVEYTITRRSYGTKKRPESTLS